jgi:hypothetical protein
MNLWDNGKGDDMRKLWQAVAIIFLVCLIGSVAYADEKKGQKIIIKKLKTPCGFNGAVLAKKHTQAEWKSIYDAGDLQAELQSICPDSEPLKEKYYPHVYDFLYNFALDSGNVPSC